MKKINLSKILLLALFSVIGVGQSLAQSVYFRHNQAKGYQQSTNYDYRNFSDLNKTTGSDWIASGNSSATNQTLTSSNQTCIHRYNQGTWAGDLIDWFTTEYTIPSYSYATFSMYYTVQATQNSSNSISSVRAAFFDYGTDANNYWSSRNQNANGEYSYKTSNGILSSGSWASGNKIYQGESVAAWIYQSTSYYYELSKIVNIDNSNGTSEKTENRYGVFSSSKSISADNKSMAHSTYLFIKYSCDLKYCKYVTFDANGGTGTMEVQTIKNSGSLTPNTYTRDGYIFGGWNTQADGKGTAYTNCGVISASSTDKGPVTLYAQWKPTAWTYTEQIKIGTISIDATANGLSYNGHNPTQSWGGGYSQSLHEAGDQGVSHDGNSTLGTSQVSISIYKQTKNIPAYSKFTRNASFAMYAGTNWAWIGCGLYMFDDESTAKSTSLDVHQEQNTTFGDAYKIMKCSTTVATGAHQSWSGSKTITYDNSTGSSDKEISKYIDLVHSSLGNAGSTAYTTPWVTWKETNSTNESWSYYKYVTFDPNGGTGTAMAVQTVEENTAAVMYCQLTKNTYTLDGYTFVGWNTKADGSGTAYNDQGAIGASSTNKGPVTLYAQWAKTIATGTTLKNGDKLNITTNSIVVKESGKNGLVIASGATATIHIAEGMTLTVYGGDGNGVTAGKAGILLPSGSTLNVTGKGTLIVYGGNAGNGTNGGKGWSKFHGKNDLYAESTTKKHYQFTSYPGSGGNGGGGAGAGIGTDGSNGANGQSVGNHYYWDWWADRDDNYGTWTHSSCLSPAIQQSAEVAACGTLNISTNTESQLYGGKAGTPGSMGQQDMCVGETGYESCRVFCGAGGAGGGGGAGAAGAGYGIGGRGGQGGSCGKCGQHARLNKNTSYAGTSNLQGTQGTTGSTYAAGTESTKGTIHPVTIGGEPVTDFTNVAITDVQDLVINEEETVDSISYTRTMTNAWGTICLPFALESNKKVQYYKLAEVEGKTMTFELVSSVAANTPAIFRRLNLEDYKASAGQTTLSAEIKAGEGEVANWSLTGTFNEVVLNNTDTTKYYIANNQFWQATQATEDITIPAYRAYFTYTSPTPQEAKPTFFNIAIAGDPTVIGSLDTETGELNIMTDGKYLENGNVIIIKNGKKYNVKGQKIK